ncbi:MAG: NADH-quinone oxidoreductase subunit H [Planctomycetota bacterium]|nr:NADH-quinone oxidoreductase subunit H [Planctomycetota bacterium]
MVVLATDVSAYGWKVLPVVLVFGAVLGIVPLLVYLERKICALIQNRDGPNRVGLLGPDGLAEGLLGTPIVNKRFLGGLLQPLADAIKLITKEDFIPSQADKFLFSLAPFFALLPPFLAFVVIPVGADLTFGGGVKLQVADLGIGMLWVLAVSSLSAYGIQLGGWASNSKYALLGGVRATAQMISYEIGMGLILVSVFMYYDTVSLREVVLAQSTGVDEHGARVFSSWIGGWGVWRQPLACLIFVVCAFAENNRLPFDMPECEAELVGGYHTEYSSMKFGMFFQGEYIAMVAMGAITTTLFFGGWHYPGYGALAASAPNFAALLSLLAFGLKVFLFILFQMWVRWTLPRFRYDHVMTLGWKILIPLALANLVVTAMVKL